MKSKITLFCTSICLLLSSCHSTPKRQVFDPYIPKKDTLASHYPFQFTGITHTANERLQAKSRYKVASPIYSCLAGNTKLLIIGNEMVEFGSLDKKEWPSYGYITNGINSEKAADGSTNHEVYFNVEVVEHKNRNSPTYFYGNNYYGLEWNDEIINGWMHGRLQYRATGFYEGDKVTSFSGKMFSVKAKCVLVTNPETIKNIKISTSYNTMTPAQLNSVKVKTK